MKCQRNAESEIPFPIKLQSLHPKLLSKLPEEGVLIRSFTVYTKGELLMAEKNFITG